ncbi:MAG: creatininase family protein [Acidilobus sp.]
MIRLGELSSDSVEGVLKDRSTIVVLPIGSIEQHCRGPIGADAMIAEGIAEAACGRLEASGYRCVMAPPIEYGFSPEWSLAPGTLGLGLQAFQSILTDVVRGLVRMGAQAIVIVNGHYGNSPAIEATLRDLMSALPPEVAVVQVNYWESLDIDVGHASDAEAEVMRALGYNVDFGRCACEVTASPRGARVYRRPAEASAQLRAPVMGQLTKEYMATAVATAIDEGLRAARGSRRPLP